MEDRIVTDKILIKQVAKELQLTESQVNDIIKNNLEYIKKLVDDTETLTIRIPHLGNLYFHSISFHKLNKKRKTLLEKGKKLENYEEVIFSSMEPKYIKLREYELDVRMNRKKLDKFRRLKHNRRKLTNVTWHADNKSIKQIEEFQNNYANEKRR